MSEVDKIEIVKSWFQKAENDLINAEQTMIMEKPPCDTVCFHAEQCEDAIESVNLAKKVKTAVRKRLEGKL